MTRLLSFLVAAVLAGTASSSRAAPDHYPYRAVCTVGMVADMVRAVAGEHASVEALIGEGVDPHLYKPTRGDVAALLGADVVFYSGLMLEGKMTDTLVKVGRSGKSVYAVTELVEESYLLEPPGMPGHHDPHVWMDVGGWRKAVEAVAASLQEFDPPHAQDYASRASAYSAELERLDDYIREILQRVPADRRVLVTAHDAFQYFGRAYGVDVRGIQGISTESEAGLEDLNRLVDLIVDRRINAVFVESSVADKNVRALVEGARSRGRELAIGGTLFSDAMGPAGSYEGTYVGMMDHNATTIARALGGEAPAKGWQGRLRGAP